MLMGFFLVFLGCSCLQVEFYFSDSNLPRDNFLKKTISENEDGCILALQFIVFFALYALRMQIYDMCVRGCVLVLTKALFALVEKF